MKAMKTMGRKKDESGDDNCCFRYTWEEEDLTALSRHQILHVWLAYRLG